MRAIVFGGSGFLGSHVADILSDRGYKVTIFDLYPSQFIRKNQEMIVGDILDQKAVSTAIKGCTYVYNFAGIADLDDASVKPFETIQLNIVGNLNIMEAARIENVQRFIYASTIYVYSQKGGFYRCSKQASEVYIEEYQRRFGLNFTILRYGTLYGPRSDERNSVYRCLKQAMETGCVICSGSGEGIRDYIFVRDAARLSVDVLKDDYCNQHIIISGQHPMKFKELILMTGEILGKKIKIKYTETKNPDHYDYTPYSFTPKIGQKLVNHIYLDMGQGLLECLHEMHEYSG